MGPYDRLKLGTSIGVGFWFLVRKLQRTAKNVKNLQLNPVLAGVQAYSLFHFFIIAYVVKLLLRYRAGRKKYYQVMESMLFDKILDSQFGAVLALMDCVQEQEFSQCVLTLFCLWTKNGFVARETLRDLCEEFIFTHWNVKIRFDVDLL